jgi:hypothetical protein
MNNWRARLRIATFLIFVGMVYAAQAYSQQPGPVDLKSASGDFKTVVTKAMTRAAEQAKVPIISDEIAVATKHNILVANAVVPETALKRGSAPLMFVYISMPGTACAKVLPPGYYTIEEQIDPLTRAPAARFVSADGKTALEYVPVNREITKRPDERAEYPGRLPFTAEVRIQQTGIEQAQMIVVFHRVRCHHDAGYDWWEWVTITIGPDGPG